MFERITMNLAGAQKRYETLDGETYLVLPAVMLTEGVWNGSQGPLLYQGSELSKRPVGWDHKPVVIYHPELNETNPQGSACNPAVVERQRIGMLFNTGWDNRLKTEAWTREDKWRRLDPATLDKVHNGEMVEISTGLYHDPDPTPGEWNGKKYSAIVRNIVGDHLAILPEGKGACGIADGAGLLRNSANGTIEVSYDGVREQLRALLKSSGDMGYVYVCDVFPKYAVYESGDAFYRVNYKVDKAGKVSISGDPEKVRRVTSYVANDGGVYVSSPSPLQLPAPAPAQISDAVRRQQVESALKEYYATLGGGETWGDWATTIFADHVLWTKDGKVFSLPYTYADDKIRFNGEPQEMGKPPTENAMPNTKQPVNNAIFRGVDGLIHDPNHRDAHQPPAMGDSQPRPQDTSGGGTAAPPVNTRKTAVDTLITSGGWAESDRQYLEQMSDAGFKRVVDAAGQGFSGLTTPYSQESVGDRSNVHRANNQQPTTINEYMASLPPEMRELVNDALATQNQEKERLVVVITTNQRNRFSKEWLMTQKVPFLQGLAQLAGVPVEQPRTGPAHNYSGQGEVPMFATPAAVQNQGYQPEVLPIPGMTFEKEAG